jgi:hypothetical protein
MPMGGFGPLPFAAMDAYASRYGITGEEFEIFVRLITAMDSEYLQHVNAKDDSG